jgi:hypothetical protein
MTTEDLKLFAIAGLSIAAITLWVAFVGSLAYTAVHFIVKFW